MDIKLLDGSILSNSKNVNIAVGDKLYLRHESELIEVQATEGEYNDGKGVLYKVDSQGTFQGLVHLMTDN